MTSKLSIAALIAAVISLLGSIMAYAQTASTVPVGFQTVTVNAGQTKAFSVPLKETPVFAAAVTGTGSTTLTTGSAGWTTNQFGPYASNPHLVRMLSGTSQGRHFRIASNTADTLTITGTTLNGIVAVGNTYEIVPVDTLGSLFGTVATSGTLPSGVLTGANPAACDNIMVRGSFGWLTYYNDGLKWLLIGGEEDEIQNNLAILPEFGVLVVRRGGTPLSLTVLGVVPSTQLLSTIPGSKTTLLANRFPVNTTLNSLGLHSDVNWIKGANPATVDNVLVRGSFGWLTYYHNGTNWLLLGGEEDENQNNTAITAGSAVLLVRRGANTIELAQALPYSL